MASGDKKTHVQQVASDRPDLNTDASLWSPENFAALGKYDGYRKPLFLKALGFDSTKDQVLTSEVEAMITEKKWKNAEPVDKRNVLADELVQRMDARGELPSHPNLPRGWYKKQLSQYVKHINRDFPSKRDRTATSASASSPSKSKKKSGRAPKKPAKIASSARPELFEDSDDAALAPMPAFQAPATPRARSDETEEGIVSHARNSLGNLRLDTHRQSREASFPPESSSDDRAQSSSKPYQFTLSDDTPKPSAFEVSISIIPMDDRMDMVKYDEGILVEHILNDPNDILSGMSYQALARYVYDTYDIDISKDAILCYALKPSYNAKFVDSSRGLGAAVRLQYNQRQGLQAGEVTFCMVWRKGTVAQNAARIQEALTQFFSEYDMRLHNDNARRIHSTAGEIFAAHQSPKRPHHSTFDSSFGPGEARPSKFQRMSPTFASPPPSNLSNRPLQFGSQSLAHSYPSQPPPASEMFARLESLHNERQGNGNALPVVQGDDDQVYTNDTSNFQLPQRDDHSQDNIDPNLPQFENGIRSSPAPIEEVQDEEETQSIIDPAPTQPQNEMPSSPAPIPDVLMTNAHAAKPSEEGEPQENMIDSQTQAQNDQPASNTSSPSQPSRDGDTGSEVRSKITLPPKLPGLIDLTNDADVEEKENEDEVEVTDPPAGDEDELGDSLVNHARILCEHLSPNGPLKHVCAIFNISQECLEKFTYPVRLRHWKKPVFMYQLLPTVFFTTRDFANFIRGGMIGDAMGTGKTIEIWVWIWYRNELVLLKVDVAESRRCNDGRHLQIGEQYEPDGTPRPCPTASEHSIGCPCVGSSFAEKFVIPKGVNYLSIPPSTIPNFIRKADDFVDLEAAGIQLFVQKTNECSKEQRKRGGDRGYFKAATQQDMNWILNRKFFVDLLEKQLKEDERCLADDIQQLSPNMNGAFHYAEVADNLQSVVIVDSNRARNTKLDPNPLNKFSIRIDYKVAKITPDPDNRGKMRRWVQGGYHEKTWTFHGIPIGNFLADEAHENHGKDTNLNATILPSLNSRFETSHDVYFASGTFIENGIKDLTQPFKAIYDASALNPRTGMSYPQHPWHDPSRPKRAEAMKACLPEAYKQLCKDFSAVATAEKDDDYSDKVKELNEDYQSVVSHLFIRRDYDTLYRGVALRDELNLPKSTDKEKLLKYDDEQLAMVDGYFDERIELARSGSKTQKGRYQKLIGDYGKIQTVADLPAFSSKTLRVKMSWYGFRGKELSDEEARRIGFEGLNEDEIIDLTFGQITTTRAMPWIGKGDKYSWYAGHSNPYEKYLPEITKGALKRDRLHADLKAKEAKTEDQGRKATVFAHTVTSGYVFFLDAINEGFDCRFVSSDTTQGDRDKIVREFQAGQSSKPQFIFASSRVLGMGIELHEANSAILLHSDFNLKRAPQAKARVLRLGQEREVDIVTYLSNARLELKIMTKAFRVEMWERMRGRPETERIR